MASLSAAFRLTKPRVLRDELKRLSAAAVSLWGSTTDANRTRVQVAALGVVTLVAYHYSMSSLVKSVTLSTPLAYIGLVPVIALVVALLHGRVPSKGPAIYDRQLDWILGLPLVVGAAAIELLLPARASAMFWIWRLDLLSLPMFVAGAVTLLFGTRTLWRQKFAIGYLLLAWPMPYMLVLLNVLNGFTSLTLSALRFVVGFVPVAKPITGADGSLFGVTHHGTTFPLSVVSACSGVDSVVGFLLVGMAFGALVRGPRLIKGLWLASGMALLWGINVARILFIFWMGQTFGEHVAIDILHPFIGLITFNIGIAVMLLAVKPLGLRMISVGRREPRGGAPAAAKKPAVKNVFPAVTLLALVALVLGVNNNSLRAYDLVANSSGETRLSSYSLDPAAPKGWSVSYLTQYTWARPYFGDTSSWLRYEYYSLGAGGDLQTDFPIVADVVNTPDLSTFSAYGVEACYNFHGYTMRDVATVQLPGGIRGQSLSYSTSGHRASWTIVYWIMPVKDRPGGPTHYERVILYLQDAAGRSLHMTKTQSGGIRSLQGALDSRQAGDERLISERSFLAAFASEVIQGQRKIQPGTRLTSVTPSGMTTTAPAAATGRTAPTAAGSSTATAPTASGTAAPAATSSATGPQGPAAGLPPGVDAATVTLLRGNVAYAKYYLNLAPKERLRWRAANLQLFVGS